MSKMMSITDDDGVTRDYLVYDKFEAAEVLGVCHQRVLQLVKEKKLQAYSDGTRGRRSKRFFKADEVDFYKLHKNDAKPLRPLRPVGAEKDSA